MAPRVKDGVESPRVTVGELAVMLRCRYGTALQKVTGLGLFTVVRNSPDGTIFVPLDEATVASVEGEDALKRFRTRMHRPAYRPVPGPTLKPGERRKPGRPRKHPVASA